MSASGRLQAWLHGGYPATKDPFPFAWWFGNRVSEIRYWAWRARGGKHWDKKAVEISEAGLPLFLESLSTNGAYLSIDPTVETTSTNQTKGAA